MKHRAKFPKSRKRRDSALMTMLGPAIASSDVVKEHDRKPSVTMTDNINYHGNNFRDDNGTYMCVEKQLHDIRSVIARLETATKENLFTENNTKKIRSEWKSFATFLDRIFFVVYLFLIISSLVFIFPKPHSWALW